MHTHAHIHTHTHTHTHAHTRRYELYTQSIADREAIVNILSRLTMKGNQWIRQLLVLKENLSSPHGQRQAAKVFVFIISLINIIIIVCYYYYYYYYYLLLFLLLLLLILLVLLFIIIYYYYN